MTKSTNQTKCIYPTHIPKIIVLQRKSQFTQSYISFIGPCHTFTIESSCTPILLVLPSSIHGVLATTLLHVTSEVFFTKTRPTIVLLISTIFFIFSLVSFVSLFLLPNLAKSRRSFLAIFKLEGLTFLNILLYFKFANPYILTIVNILFIILIYN